MPPYPICPMFQTQCRFCSHEHHTIPFARLVEDPRTKRLIAGPIEHRRELIDIWCNNVGNWVKDLNWCPARWGLYRNPIGIRADGCGEYSDAYGQSQIIRDDEFLAVGVGQQVLGI